MWQRDSHQLQIIELQGEISAKEDTQKIKDQTQITKDTTDGWKAALDYTRAHYAERLRNASAPQMPGISKPTSGADETRDYPIPAAEQLAAECAETTLTLNYIQSWVSKMMELQ